MTIELIKTLKRETLEDLVMAQFKRIEELEQKAPTCVHGFSEGGYTTNNDNDNVDSVVHYGTIFKSV